MLPLDRNRLRSLPVRNLSALNLPRKRYRFIKPSLCRILRAVDKSLCFFVDRNLPLY